MSVTIPSDADTRVLVQTRLLRLRELEYLTADPLLARLFSLKESESQSSLASRAVSSDEKLVQGIVLNREITRNILRAIDAAVYRRGSHRKRPAESELHNESKIPRVASSSSSHIRSANDRKQSTSASSVKSLKTALEAAQDELDLFLDRDIAEMEILLVPEHYPTKPHTVSSLAELYYLTQTLPLIKLLPGSHKVLMTDNFELALLEGKIAVLYLRIEELKRQGKWSLRQPLKFYDPFTYKKKSKKITFYWDNLLAEAKWMATDFHESAKFKRACCVMLAQAVSDYWTYGKSVCVKRKQIVHLTDAEVSEHTQTVVSANEESVDVDMNQEPEHEADHETETVQEQEEPVGDDTKLTVVKELATIDTKLLQQDAPIDLSVVEKMGQIDLEMQQRPQGPFKMFVDLNDLKKIDQSIIKNLPKFTAFDDDSNVAPVSALKPSESPLASISRLIHPFEDDNNWHKIILKDTNSSSKNVRTEGPPEYQKGLFGIQSHRRFNYLKPPKPPLIKNIEYRSPTIWLPQDDKYLIHYVAEFSFNWELISEHLLTSSSASSLKKYESNIERRTPWQCFERYIQLNEKFQFSDMKGVYAYHAQQWLEQAHKAQLTTKRRISPLGVGAESIQRGHRRLRWASMFDAMRKCMKKREIAVAKVSQRRTTNDYSAANTNSAGSGSGTTSVALVNGSVVGSAGSASAAGASVVKRPMDRVPNPAELSKLKFERDKSIQEAYLNQQATRSRMLAAVAQQKQQQGQPLLLLQQLQQLQLAGPTQSANSPQQLPLSFPSQEGPPSQQLGNISSVRVPASLGSGSVQSRNANGSAGPSRIPPSSGAPISGQSSPVPGNQQLGQLPNGIRRPTTPNGTPYTNEQIQQLIQLQKQRRLMQQQNQQNKTSIGSSSSSGGLSIQNSQSKHMVPNKVPQGPGQQQSITSNSNQAQTVPPQQLAPKPRIHFAPAQVSAIINSIQQKNPGFSKEQVTKLAAQYLANLQQQQQLRFTQQQQQQLLQQQTNTIGQQVLSGAGNIQYRGSASPVAQQQQLTQQKGQIASLTPQERNQLQMLKAAKSAQQQHLQQQLQLQKLQQQQQQHQQQQLGHQSQLLPQQLLQLQQQRLRKSLSPGGGESPLDISKLDYEQRKRLLQKQQQQQQQ